MNATERNTVELKVSNSSPVSSLAGSIIKSIEGGFPVILRAIGASAVNQMYKGIASARGTLAAKGYDILIRPGFRELLEQEDGKTVKKTVMIADLVVKGGSFHDS